MSFILSVSTTSLVSARSDDNDGGAFTKADKEYCLTDSEIAFIRPGLEIEILDVVIPDDRQTEVTVKFTDPAGLPLDKDGVYTPGSIRPRWALSYIPAVDNAYVSFITREATSAIKNETATQATDETNGTYTELEDGVYIYKFATMLPETASCLACYSSTTTRHAPSQGHGFFYGAPSR